MLEDVVAFVTGSPRVPAIGFDTTPSILFMDNDSRLPDVSTCALSITLPKRNSQEEFSDMMKRAIIESPTFGYA